MAVLSSIFARLSAFCTNPSFMSVYVTWWSYIWKFLGNFALKILDFIIDVAWTICKFVLGVMEAFEYIINSFLGIGVGPSEMLDQAKNIGFLDTLVVVFKALFGLAIVFLIIFTIFAIIRQEIQTVQEGFENGDGKTVSNDKKDIIMRIFKSLMGMVLLPLTMIFILVGVSAALTSFNNALKGPNNPTIASQVLASSTYDANRFRKYANLNKRMPIIIEAYNPDEYGADQNSDLVYKIKSGQVQSSLIKTAISISENSFLPFDKTVSYKNNKLTNSSNYGSIYENFICTAEQYQVMADFVDFAELTGTTYYIKALDEKDIEWKYVDSSVFNSNDNSLTIKYRDANDINGDGSNSDTYEITYKMSYNVTSPISDALKSIMAMLGIGEYSDDLYKIMERNKDFLNVVNWSNEKVLIKFSDKFDATNPKTWTHSDQIIIYEFYHFSSNNTFAKYSLSDIKKGVELDALKINYRDYYPEAAAYSPERTVYGVLINGTYYNTVKSNTNRDSFGNFYYELKTYDDVEFLNDTFTTINVVEGANTNLKLSQSFNINNTSTWTYTDEILVYEFYKDLSYMNTLRKDPYVNKNLIFSDYDYDKGGVNFPVYKIASKSIENGAEQKVGYYLLINGTYYELSNQGGVYYLISGGVGTHFLTEAAAEAFLVYNYKFDFNGVSADITGIDGGEHSANSFIYEALASSVESELSESDFEKYGSFALSFSSTFDYKDPSTWTYRDYFLFYIFAKYPGIANSVDELKYSSLYGELCKVRGSVQSLQTNGQVYLTNEVVLAIDYGTGSNYKRIYLDINKIKNISTMKMITELSHKETEMLNNFDYNDEELFVGFADGSNLYNAETEIKNFNFSDSFDASTLSTWTTGDLVLVALSKAGYLPEIEDLVKKESGYNSLVYKLNGTNYYRFSKNGSNFGNDVVYLSESNVLSMRFFDGTDITVKFNSLDEWLNSSAISFVAKLYGTTSSDLQTDFNGISNSLYSEISSSVFGIDQIIDELVNRNGFIIDKGDTFEIYDDITNYNYTNSNFDFNDISTWTALDAAIYYLTGNAVGSYSSYIIKKENDLYFVVGEKAVKISEGTFSASISQNNTITSSKSKYDVANRPNFSDVVKNDYSGLIFDASSFEDENGNSKLSYYKSSEFSYNIGNASSDTYVYDILEIILRGFGHNGNTFAFKIYTDGSDYYIRVKNNTDNKYYYIFVADISTSSSIRFSEESKLELDPVILNKKWFKKVGTYSAFGGIDVNDLTASEFTYLDSLIFKISGSMNKNNFDVMTTINADGSDGKSYIAIHDGKGLNYVEFKSADSNPYNIATANSTFASQAHLLYLFKNYYASLIKNPGDLDPESVLEAKISTSFSVSDINSWTPLNVILYMSDLIEDGASNFEISGEYVTSVSGENKYLRITATLENGNEEVYIILLNDICEITINEDNTVSLANINSAIAKLYLELFLAVEQIDGEYSDQNSYISSNYLTFNQNLDNLLNISDNSSNVDDLSSIINATATESNSKSWTWFDLIYYKYFGNFRTDSQFKIYTDATGKTFVGLEVNNSTKYIYINDVLLLAPENSSISSVATGSVDFEFDLNSAEFTNLSLIAFKQTGSKEGSLDFIKMPVKKVGAGYEYLDEIYFVQNASNLNYYAICDVNDVTLNVKVSDESLTFSKVGDDVISYNAFDFLLKYLGMATDLSSKVYTYGNSQFIKIGEQYINITKINLVYNETISKNVLLIKGTDTSESSAITFDKMSKLLSFSSNNSSSGVLNTYTDNNFAPKLDAASNNNLVNFKFAFSKDFKPYDYNTWKLSDFIIYYFFKEGYFKDSRGKTITNFQTIIENGGVNCYIKHNVKFDRYGSAISVKVVKLGEGDADIGTTLLNFDVLQQLFARDLKQCINIISQNNVDVEFSTSVSPSNPSGLATIKDFSLAIRTDLVSNSFVYDNYFFFNENKDSSVLDRFDLFDVSDVEYDNIINGSASVETVGKINMQLSSGFDISDVSTWTVLDYIIIKEASRSVNGNVFEGANLKSLKETSNVIDVLSTSKDKVIRLIYINGMVYNLTSYLKTNADGSIFVNANNEIEIDKKINECLRVDANDNNSAFVQIISKGSVDDYNIRFNSEKISFMVRVDNGIKETDFKTPTSFSYPQKVDGVETDFYYSVNTNVFGNFKIDLNDTIKYPPDHLFISPIVREVNWPQKLMNDMFVLYPNLNWETLISTSGWIDTLGDFTSANTSGNIIESGNSANITAAGLVLSEFFLSVAKENNNGISDYEYSPVFDEEVIKSLMLSLMGEENYNAVKSQAKIFSEMFNYSFASVLDDIAAEMGLEVVDGKVDNFTMSIYKSYLATIMLSSDFGEYLYKIATRVYAQYTIYESLAYAGGDYAKYYAFVNGLTDENGNVVTSFSYGSFYELVKYENSVIGNGTPTFTFNYRKVYRALINEDATDQEILASLNDYSSFMKVYKALDAEYSRVYGNTSDILISDNDDIYCFLSDVYWSTYKRLLKRGTSPKRFPEYINIFKDYLDGNIARWASVEGVDATASANQIQYYNLYKAQLLIQSLKVASVITPLYGIELDYNTFDAIEDVLDYADRFNENRPAPTAPINVLKKTFANSNEYLSLVNSVLQENPLSMIHMLINSPKGDVKAWNDIIKLKENVSKILSEFGAVCSLSAGESNSNGSLKVESIDDKDYDKTYDALSKMYNNLDSYCALQTKLDVITKSSITFMLGQFGANYVTEGYSFNIENRNYTLTTTTSTGRIAEYVYGGAFLEKFGIEPIYTDHGSAGMMEILVAYDHYDGRVKLKLSSFKELRQFVSSIADYTAKLYYLSNFNDLSENISDGLLLTDYIYAYNPLDVNKNDKILVTPEYLIITYLALNEDISTDTFIRLIVGDTERTLENLGVLDNPIYANIVRLVRACGSEYLLTEMSEEEKRIAIVEYMNFVMSDIYSSFGYYNPGGTSTASERMHLVFKNVISYLITSEDEGETVYENAAKLDAITFKQFKRLLMEKIVDFTQNSNESGAENATRYIALFNLISSEFNYFAYSGSGDVVKSERIGRTIKEELLSRQLVGGEYIPVYDNGQFIFGGFSISTASKNIVLKLAGLENRPIEELVNLEYNSLYDRDGNYDEAKGDTFILCTYDDRIGKYVPILARDTNGGSFASDSNYAKYRADYADQKLYVTTSYYNDPSGKAVAQPIVAKGVLTADLKPTAIKMEDHKVRFYRTDISAAASLTDEALNLTRITQETQTIGFTKFVNTATSTKLSGTNSQTNFIAQSNITSFLKSDASVYYLQVTNAYDCSIDGFNEFNVLDTFSYFYALGFIEYFLLVLAFSTVIPLLFRGCIAVVQRIFDLTFLTLIGPVVISTESLNVGDSKKKSIKIFEKWRNYLTQSLLQAFGIVVGFNVYYILMSTITGMTFVSEFTIGKITAIGGFNFFSANFVNAIVKFLFIVTAGSIIRGAGNLLTQIITMGKVTDAFSSPISGDGLKNISDVYKSIKGSFTNVKDAFTGKLLLEAKDAAIQSFKHSLPGSELVGKAIDAGRWATNKVKDKAMRKALEAHGVSKSVSKKMVKEFRKEENKQRQLKKINQAKSANAFMKRVGGPEFDVPKQKGDDKKGGKKGKAPYKDTKDKKNKKSSREDEFEKENEKKDPDKLDGTDESKENKQTEGEKNNQKFKNETDGSNGEANKPPENPNNPNGENGKDSKGDEGKDKGAKEEKEMGEGAVNPAAYIARHPIKFLKEMDKAAKEQQEDITKGKALNPGREKIDKQDSKKSGENAAQSKNGKSDSSKSDKDSSSGSDKE